MMDTNVNEVKLPPVKNHSNGIKKLEINGELEANYSTEKTATASEMPLHDRLPRDMTYVSYRRTAADNVDKVSRVLFPVLFTIYNIVYWAVYALPGNKSE